MTKTLEIKDLKVTGMPEHEPSGAISPGIPLDQPVPPPWQPPNLTWAELQVMGLDLQEERFCRLYMSQEFFGDGVMAYFRAFNIDPVTKWDWVMAKKNAKRLLGMEKINQRISQLIDLTGFNDNFMDKQLLFVATQNYDLKAKMQALKEYNELKARVQKTPAGPVINILTYEQYLTNHTNGGSGKALPSLPDVQGLVPGVPAPLSEDQGQEFESDTLPPEQRTAEAGGSDSEFEDLEEADTDSSA